MSLTILSHVALSGFALATAWALATTCGVPFAPSASNASSSGEPEYRELAHLELPGLAELCERGLEDPILARAAASELGRLFRERSGLEPAGALAMADAWFGRPVLEALAELAGERAEVSFGILDEKPTWAIVFLGRDAGDVRATVERSVELIAANAGLRKLAPQRREACEAWNFGASVLGLVGARVALAPNVRALEQALQRASLSNSAERTPGALLARASIDLAALREVEDGDSDGFATGLARIFKDPGVQIVFGAQLATIGQGDVLELEIDWQQEALELRAVAQGVEWGQALSLRPSASDAEFAVPALLEAPRTIASARIFRDFATVFAERGEIFDRDTAAAFTKGIADVALFFAGADISEEVLPHVSPWMRLLALEPEFDAGREPEIPLPAAALVLELKNPEELGPRLTSAFQSFAAMTNVDRAQRGGAPLEIDLEATPHGTLTSAHFPTPAPGAGVDMQYNLEPACLRVERFFVLATHKDAARRTAELLRAEAKRRGAAHEAATEKLWLSGTEIHTALEKNSAAFIAQAELDKGLSREEAEAEWRGVLALAKLCSASELELQSPANDRIDLTWRLELAETRANDTAKPSRPRSLEDAR